MTLIIIVFLVALIIGFGISSSETNNTHNKDTDLENFQSPHNTHHHSDTCDGNCANCPPHYGYRYGRWYYGHGHQYGCQKDGNGGASGRTYRD